MEPLIGAGAPPVPHGRAAVEAWRGLDRRLRGRLLDGSERNPDPMTAVIAVGYARTWLSGVQRRGILLRLGMFFALIAVDLVVGFSLGVPAQATAVLFPVAAVCILLVTRLVTAKRIVRMTRMETDLASRLWQSELRDPALFAGVPAAPAWSAKPVAVRYAGKSLARFYGTALGFIALVIGFLWLGDSALAIPLTALMLVLLGMSVYAIVRFVRPWMPAMTMDAEGVTLTVQGAKVPWSQIPEIRVMPVKGGGFMVAKRSVVVFMVADPEALLSRLTSRPLRMARRTQAAYASPLAIADVALDRSAEDIAQTVKGFTTAPVRRFAG